VLTVFIATLNGASTLPRVLASYTQLQPPHGGWKLVIIDNGSDDGCAQLAESFGDRLPLICVSEPRRGKNRALNTGLRELEGDLAVFSDDDTLPKEDWLVQLRNAADRHREYAIFGGSVGPIWEVEPEDWIVQWVRLAPVFGITHPAWEEGPCDPPRVFGANMAIRAEVFGKRYRFDEGIGPNGSGTYAMGGETELTLRLVIAEHLKCWHCKEAFVRHIIPSRKMTRTWILKRAFRLGRCGYRESKQKAAARHPHVRRDPLIICKQLAVETSNLASARRVGDARRAFEARWQLNLGIGCLFEAATTRYKPLRLDVRTHA
jgi:glycosyltransferase involved in cell wall biosynthesis